MNSEWRLISAFRVSAFQAAEILHVFYFILKKEISAA
jgi:hypothetical protein